MTDPQPNKSSMFDPTDQVAWALDQKLIISLLVIKEQIFVHIVIEKCKTNFKETKAGPITFCRSVFCLRN